MAGRGQLKWGSVEQLKQLIEMYFIESKEKGQVPCIPGICLALEISRETWNYYSSGRYEERLCKKTLEAREQAMIEAGSEEDYQEDRMENYVFDNAFAIEGGDEIDVMKAEVSAALKNARVRLEYSVMQEGFGAKNPAFHIFYMKNAFGYRDQPEEVHATQNNIQLNIRLDTSGTQNIPNQPVITFTAEPVDE